MTTKGDDDKDGGRTDSDEGGSSTDAMRMLQCNEEGVTEDTGEYNDDLSTARTELSMGDKCKPMTATILILCQCF